MKIILSGGGTGGHIYPAIAIADALKQHNPHSKILFIGAQGKMEMQQVPSAGYPIIGLPVRGIKRKCMLCNILLPAKLVRSYYKAKAIIKRFHPNLVIGTGGYASASILYVATQRGIPTLIQEQNAHAGLTNRLLAKRVTKLCVAYEGMHQYFPMHKIVLTGNPVRQHILNLKEKGQAAYDYFELDINKQCLLVLGGSQGAKAINESVLQALPQLIKASIQIIWLIGHFYYKDIQAQLVQRACLGIKAFPFIDRIDLAYAAADVIVSRGGASAIAELCVAQKPTIFIPSPNVIADHQTTNVLPVVNKQAAILLPEKKARQKLGQTVLQLLSNKTQQKTLRQNMKLLAKPNATNDILKLIHQLVHDSNS